MSSSSEAKPVRALALQADLTNGLDYSSMGFFTAFRMTEGYSMGFFTAFRMTEGYSVGYHYVQNDGERNGITGRNIKKRLIGSYRREFSGAVKMRVGRLLQLRNF